MSDVLIIGYGVVGKNLSEEIKKLNCDITDKYKNIKPKKNKHDFGFVCVDTPLTNNGSFDTTEVENAINENDCDIYILKSTCPINEVDYLKEKTGKHIVFSPEYYGGTQHCNNFKFDFTVLGGDKEDCIAVQQLLQEVYDGRHRFFITDAKTAEMSKLMENCWLATKVSFCISFYKMCKEQGISYEEVREIFISDPRVNESHTFVYSDHPYWESHCLDKDVPFTANAYDNNFLKSVIEYNNECKNKK